MMDQEVDSPAISVDIAGIPASRTLGSMSEPPPLGLISVAPTAVEKRCNRTDGFARAIVSGEAESGWPEDAGVGFEHHDVLRKLGPVRISIGNPAPSAVLFVGPQDDPDGSAGPHAELLHQPDRFPGRHAPAAVVARAGADVPGIDVSANDHDLVGPFSSAPITDHVGRFGIGFEMRLHLQPDGDARAAVGHPLQAIGVLRGDGRRRNLRRVLGILERSGVAAA